MEFNGYRIELFDVGNLFGQLAFHIPHRSYAPSQA